MRSYVALLTLVFAACSGGMQAGNGTNVSPDPEPATEEQAQESQGQEGDGQDTHLGGTLQAAATVDPGMSELSPGRIEITRGDTIRFEGILRDGEGNRIDGARWGVFEVPEIFSVESIKDRARDSYLLVGEGPGTTRLRAVLVIQREGGVSYEPLFDVEVVVKEWPAATVEIAEPAYGAYVGSVFQMQGTVLTTHGTEHATAEIHWSSSDPRIMEVTPNGVASFKAPGRVELRAKAEGIAAARMVDVEASPVASAQLEPANSEVRTGEVVQLKPILRQRSGRAVRDVHVAFAVTNITRTAGGAVVYDDGAFVAESPGIYRVIASAAGATATAVVTAKPRNAGRGIELIGRGALSHVSTSDLWVFEGRDGRDYAYTGTHAEGGGQRMFVWDVTDKSAPTLLDSVVVDARVVNDVKINDDATVAVITREGASSRRNGMVLLDITDPAHPTVLSEFNTNLTGGVHNTWINGDVVYAVHNGTNAMHIVDISDPANPAHVGRWETRPGEEDKNLHDIWVQDGLAYLSYWDDGLIILDVGAGIKGGTPTEPRFVSQYSYPIGNTHTAYRYGDYVFVGDEIFGCDECTNGPRGYIHVIDVRDIEDPKEVAKFEVPEAGAHNIWVEDGLLYIAYYQGGLRVVDVTGELRGDLYDQGRQVAWFHTAAPEGEGLRSGAPLAWGPQVFKGYVFVSDMNSGLWVVQLEPTTDQVLP